MTNHIHLLYTSHIDLPIYSVPDNEIATMKNDVMFSKGGSDRFLWYEKTEGVLLATDGGWLKSDPRVIHEWVKKTKSQFNDFVYYSRYLKAWRDHQWSKSQFSSIIITAGTAQALSEDGYSKNKNIALELSKIATSLKLYLSNGGIKDPDNTERLDTDERLPNRDEIIQELDTLAINLSNATKTNNTKLLINCFGNRFPNYAGGATNIGIAAPAIIPSSAPIRQSMKF